MSNGKMDQSDWDAELTRVVAWIASSKKLADLFWFMLKTWDVRQRYGILLRTHFQGKVRETRG